ncbi:MAG: hypothetical protein U5J83_09700 [Bryobacterales bacterium]|nr:hypothetical protein [Bryobacterales bacterium]
MRDGVQRMREEGDYRGALEAIASLRPAVDAFFDQVLVNAGDENVRRNRLGLLHQLLTELSAIAGFSEIELQVTSVGRPTDVRSFRVRRFIRDEAIRLFLRLRPPTATAR